MVRLLSFFTLIPLLPLLCYSFSLENPTDRRILVLVDDFAIKSSHSLFFKSLQIRGFELDFKLADDPKIGLQRYGQYIYDGLIIFSPTIERFGGSVDLAAILDFVDSGHDLIIAADASASDLIREVVTECGVDFDEDPAAVVIDHTSYAVSDTEGDHTLIASDDFIQADVILGREKIEAPVLFQGIGHSLNPANDLVLKVLSASPSAYSANPKSKLSNPPSLSGSTISLVSVVQEMEVDFDTHVIRVARNCGISYRCVYCDEIFHTEDEMVQHLLEPELDGGHVTGMLNTYNNLHEILIAARPYNVEESIGSAITEEVASNSEEGDDLFMEEHVPHFMADDEDDFFMRLEHRELINGYQILALVNAAEKPTEKPTLADIMRQIWGSRSFRVRRWTRLYGRGNTDEA